MINTPRALVVALALIYATACGGDSSRQKALRASLTALDTARDGFVAWDKAEQDRIVDQAKTYEEGIAGLAEYRDRRVPVLEGFEFAYRVLAVAAYTPNASNAIAVYVQIIDLWDRIKDLTGTAPADPPKPK